MVNQSQPVTVGYIFHQLAQADRSQCDNDQPHGERQREDAAGGTLVAARRPAAPGPRWQIARVLPAVFQPGGLAGRAERRGS